MTTLSCASCKSREATLYSYRLNDNTFSRRTVEFNAKQCKVLTVQTYAPISAKDKRTDGLVCITPQEYSKYHAELKAECINQ